MSTLPIVGGVGDGGDGGVGVVAAEIVSATVAVCVLPLEVPVKTTVALPAAAPDPAAKLNCCGTPMASVRVPGEAVTPVGAPLKDKLTGLEKPDTPTAVIVTGCALPPAVRLALAGLTRREKSAVADEFSVYELQPMVNPASSRTHNQHDCKCLSLRIGGPFTLSIWMRISNRACRVSPARWIFGKGSDRSRLSRSYPLITRLTVKFSPRQVTLGSFRTTTF